MDLRLNVETVCGQRRVYVLFSTPRSQQTWTVPTTVGQTAGESPNTPVCRSTSVSITPAVSAGYLTMKRRRTAAPKWVQCQIKNTGNYWTVSNVDLDCQMLAWLYFGSNTENEKWFGTLPGQFQCQIDDILYKFIIHQNKKYDWLIAIWITSLSLTPSLQCFYVPRCQKDSVAMHTMIMNISERLKVNQQVLCYYDPSEEQESVLLTRLYGHSAVFHSLLWPSCMLTGGTLIIVMVKFTQYLSRLCEEIGKIKRWSMGSSCRGQAYGLVMDIWQYVNCKRDRVNQMTSLWPRATFLFGYDIWNSWLYLCTKDVTGFIVNWMFQGINVRLELFHETLWLTFCMVFKTQNIF